MEIKTITAKNELLIHPTIWMNPSDMLSKGRRYKTDFIYIKFKKWQNELMLVETRRVITPGVGGWSGKTELSEVMEMFYILIWMMVT